MACFIPIQQFANGDLATSHCGRALSIALLTLVWIFASTTVAGTTVAGNEPDGKKLYSIHCASCHGDQAQGVAGQFDDPLIGDLPIDQLTAYIAETMPESDPDLIVGKDAKAVSHYLYDQFYSEAAQRRRNQPRVELSRLTAGQYRTSVADLIGRFTKPAWLPKERGLKAYYFAASSWRKDLQLAEQIDREINFTDGVAHFDASYEFKELENQSALENLHITQRGFSVFWIGSIMAPMTGEYRFKVKTKSGFRLHVNDPKTAAIDRLVRSDDGLDHEYSIFLLGGRTYPFKIEYILPKSSAESTGTPQIQFLWKPPQQPETIVPESAFVPFETPQVYVVDTAFPADDAAAGYERGVDISEQWDQATTEAAIEAAVWVARRIDQLARFKMTEPENVVADKAQEFCTKFVQAAFNTDLSDEDIYLYVGQHFEKPIAIEDQVKRSVLMTLKSPRFLFPAIENRSPSRTFASRMAMTLWDSLPEKDLVADARKGRLTSTKRQIETAYWMVDDFRTHAKLNRFFDAWLTAHTEGAAKDSTAFPKFDQRVVADLRTSLSMYLDEVVWSDASDFRQLFVAEYLYVNRRLADFYGLDYSGPGFEKVKVDPKLRSGILTHPYLMAGLAYDKDSSPIHRGVFIAKRLLGRRLRQPPNNVQPLTEAFAPEMTTRQRVEHQTKATACMNCHSVINPLGFSLENFDAVGRFRTQDNDKTVDVSTLYRSPDGNEIELNGPRDLANFLANDKYAQRTFIRQIFQFFAKQPIDAYGKNQLDRLHTNFVKHDFNIKRLLVEVALLVARQ
jgi:mono/diheme cytochrome c family protein